MARFHCLLACLGLWMGVIQPIDSLAQSVSDTTAKPAIGRTLSLEQVFQWVQAFHPVAKQADLLPDQARMEIRQARGAFDPTTVFSWYGKTLKGQDYYSDLNGELKVPTWIGIDLKAGYERVIGDNVNPEFATGNEGLAYVGLTVPIGRDWVIDQRRAALRQAQLLSNLAAADRVKEINKLLLSAAKDYWAWYEAFRAERLLRYGLGLAQFRLVGTRERIVAGDLAPLDSVEANLEVQRRQGQLYEAQVGQRNARLRLATYLWDPNGRPAELMDDVQPDSTGSETEMLSDDMMLEALSLATNQHPEILKLEAKMKQLDIERRLSINNLLPRLSVDFKPLLLPTTPTAGWNTLRGNYKYGINFYMPLFLRKETGKLGATRMKLRSTEWDLQDTRRQLLTAIETTRNDLLAYERLLALQRQTVASSRALLLGEQQKFDQGESSLFLVNQRERSLLEAELKLASYQAKYAATKVAFRWTVGRPMVRPVLGVE
jgi:outer membrane protein TolC